MEWFVRDYATNEIVAIDAATTYALYDVERVAFEVHNGRMCGVLLVGPAVQVYSQKNEELRVLPMEAAA